jgi:5-amino-6-(5-phosphoribosylamino)uracil reductase
VAERPYVLLSVAMSIDGYIDDASATRLVLSNEADLDRIDEVRSGCDAILVGAGTIRRDDPALLVRSARRRAGRRARGGTASPVKVTLTASGALDPGARFFTAGLAEARADRASGARDDLAGVSEPAGAAGHDEVTKLIYVPDPIADQARARFGAFATVISAGDPVGPAAVLRDLAARGIGRLMVEGGAMVHAEFLAAGLADELHVVIAPLLVGDPAAPRFAQNGVFPPVPAGRVRLAGVSQIGDVVLLRYLLSERPAG